MVERAIMSIINKMHQGLQENADNSPMLSSMPVQKQKKKVLLFTLISLLLASSIGLSYLIYDKENTVKQDVGAIEVIMVEPPLVVEQPSPVEPQMVEPTMAEEVVVVPKIMPIKASQSKEPSQAPEKNKESVAVKKAPTPLTVKQTVVTPPQKTVYAKVDSDVVAKKTAHLEIKKSILSPSELANIHLNSAEKALLKGDTQRAAQEKIKALNVKPDLHKVRESLALYYYGIGEQEQAKNFLKKGAVEFPEHSDFNLMLSRIALKNGEQQKAYLYLQQSPPEVEGHIDYHVSYAILAQKFKDYERSEKLYQGLLTERPNNGRWRMSLAIAQDKLSKEKLAVENYKKALLQVDLSSNAKKYINQRLTYLANQ